MTNLRWGILSTANIAQQWLIPAMQQSEHCEAVAVASRSGDKARDFAKANHIPMSFDSYEALLASDQIDAIYNPLPNHLHLPFTLKAIAAGKHVLCEKPIGLDAEQAKELIEASNQNPDIKVMEAFMYRFHPQWQHVFELVKSGQLGEIRHVASNFTFFNKDASNVRNQPGIGGGALMDVGCYCISVARSLFGSQPARVMGYSQMDTEFGVDHSTTGILDFASGSSSFFCSTQSAPTQSVKITGERASITMTTPFYRQQTPTSIQISDDSGEHNMVFDQCNHYLAEVDAFSKAVLDNTPVPTPLTDALENMQVIDALVSSSANSAWQSL